MLTCPSPEAAVRRRSAVVISLLSALHNPLLAPAATPDLETPGPVLDLQGFLDAPGQGRLTRILGKLEEDTGFVLRVVTQDRSNAPELNSLLARWRIDRRGGGIAPNAIVVVADRGLQGSLESGGSLLKFLVGDDVMLALPPVFWGRLRREYGMKEFVLTRGEAAAIITSCEIVITCLRNEDFCTEVPSSKASYF